MFIYKTLILSTTLYPSPTECILQHHDFEQYYYILTATFFATVADDEAYTLLAGWIENEWDWFDHDVEFEAKDHYERYVQLLEDYYSAYCVLKQNAFSLKALLRLSDTVTVSVESIQTIDHKTLVVHLSLYFFNEVSNDNTSTPTSTTLSHPPTMGVSTPILPHFTGPQRR